VAGVLAGCGSAGGDVDNVTYVVVTSPPQNISQNAQPTTPPPSTSDQPTLQPSSTPDVPPQITLQIADRYLLDGRYENAVFTYQILLDLGDAVPADIRAAAAYGMGQAALREGLFAQAVDAMTILINGFPNDFRAVQAYFLRGDAYLGLSQWQAAVDDFRQYLTLRPGVIDSYAYERIADALINLNQYDEALGNYQLATQSNRSTIPQAALMEKVARLHRLNNNPQAAIAQYDGILSFAQNVPYRASVELMAAQTLIDSGDLTNGILRLERVFNEYPGTDSAYDAMLVLMQNEVTLNSYRVGQAYFTAGEYQAAVDAFNRYSTEVSLGEIPPRYYLLLGQAYRAVGNDDAARVAFQTIIDQFPTDPLFGDALLEQGRTFFLAGDNENAITTYLSIADTYSYLPETAAEALWRAGYLYGTNEEPVRSREIFTRLADTFPNTEQAVSGLTIAASAAVASDEPLVAETLYARLATVVTGSEQAEAYLQLGRLAQQREDTAAAEAAFNQAIAAAPDTYYSARAQDLRVGRAPFTPPAQYVWEFDDAAQVAQAEDWLRTTFGVVQAGPLWPLDLTLEQDPRIVRGRELWAVGVFDAAQTEFLDIIRDYADDPLRSYQLAIYTRIIGAYYPSIVAAANLIIESGQSTLAVPPYIARLRYPAYYGAEVRRIAESYGFDPLVMFALIRHESLYNTYATAAAGEKGLTQVIPPTADYIAGELNWPDYQHSDLFRPYAGVAFGAFFLAENLGRFEGSVYPALAGYNAGPGRAIDWLALSGGDPDRFMANITISSTRLYIQRIYSHYNIYRALYGQD